MLGCKLQLDPEFENLQPNLTTDDAGVANYQGKPFMTTAGACTSSIVNGTIKWYHISSRCYPSSSSPSKCWELGLEKDSFPSYTKIGYKGSSFPEEILNPKKIQQFKKIQLDFNNRRHWGCVLTRQAFHNLCWIFLCTSSLVNGIVKWQKILSLFFFVFFTFQIVCLIGSLLNYGWQWFINNLFSIVNGIV